MDVFEDALARIEKRLGLTDQPRAVVFHEKEGRRHGHAVYSRIDSDSMTAINLSHFKLKLRDISKELYLEHGWSLPDGLIDHANRDPRNYTLAEYQQAKRMDHDPRELKAMVQEAWAISDSRKAFARALEDRGMILAKGDRRGHVAVTHDGEILSVARYSGQKTKAVREKLGDPDPLPTVEQAKTDHAKGMFAALTRHLDTARAEHKVRMAPLEERRQALVKKQREERARLQTRQKERHRAESKARADRLHKGVRGFIDRLTGRHARIQRENIAEARHCRIRDRKERQDLVTAQRVDRRPLQAEIIKVRQDQASLLRDLLKDRNRQRRILEPLVRDERRKRDTLLREFRSGARPDANRPSRDRTARENEARRLAREWSANAAKRDKGRDFER